LNILSKTVVIFAVLLFILPNNIGTVTLETLSETSIIFEDHRYTLHSVDGHGNRYYVETSKHLHLYNPKTGKWKRDILTTSSHIKIVHVTQNNYLFVGLRNGTLFRSIDGGQTFTVSWQWDRGGYYHSDWSIASDDRWILIGEYGQKNTSRRVGASNNWGAFWTVVYETPEEQGVHIHRVDIDPYAKDWWIAVGDYPVAGRVLYSSNYGQSWTELTYPKPELTSCLSPWQSQQPQIPYQPCNFLFFEQDILIFNEPLPQVFRVNRKTMQLEYISDVVVFPEYPEFAPIYSVVAGEYGIYASLVRYPEYIRDAGIFVSYDHGYTWQRLINFSDWAKESDPTIVSSDIFGANSLIYIDGYVYARWQYGWERWAKGEIPWDGGRAFKFKDSYYAPLTIENDDLGIEVNNTQSFIYHIIIKGTKIRIGAMITPPTETEKEVPVDEYSSEPSQRS